MGSFSILYATALDGAFSLISRWSETLIVFGLLFGPSFHCSRGDQVSEGEWTRIFGPRSSPRDKKQKKSCSHPPSVVEKFRFPYFYFSVLIILMVPWFPITPRLCHNFTNMLIHWRRSKLTAWVSFSFSFFFLMLKNRSRSEAKHAEQKSRHMKHNNACPGLLL